MTEIEAEIEKNYKGRKLLELKLAHARKIFSGRDIHEISPRSAEYISMDSSI